MSRRKAISIHSPHTRGDGGSWSGKSRRRYFNPHPSYEGRRRWPNEAPAHRNFNPLPSYEGRQTWKISIPLRRYFNPLPSCEGRLALDGVVQTQLAISIRSPLTRGDSISLQKSIRIYVSLHNKTMIHRFSELYKPLFAAQSPIFGVRSPRESHDSFTFARPSDGPGITP